MNRHDTIIIGAGHNGLVCAAMLARAGQRVLVLEAANDPGGLAAVREFHPGFRASVAHSVGHLPATLAKALDLTGRGLTRSEPLATVGLDPGGDHVVIEGDEVHGVGQADAEAYRVLARRLRRFARVMEPFWLKTLPRIGSTRLADLSTFARIGLALRGLGAEAMREFLRVASLPTRDLMDENFDDERLKAALCWDGLIGSRLAPRSPNHSVFLMLYRRAGPGGGRHWIPGGGVPGLVAALLASAEAAGAEVRNASVVEAIRVEAGADGERAVGVRLAGGETLGADRVVSAVDPQRTFFDLLGVEHLDIGFSNRIRRLRCHGLVAKLHLALDGLPEFTGLKRPDGRLILAPDMDAIEFAFDDAKHGETPKQPVMEIAIPSLRDDTLAPQGQHVLSAHVMYVPYALKGGWTEAARAEVRDSAIGAIERVAPDLRSMILHAELLTPADLEREYRVTGGHWHHTEFALDQLFMMRPTYGAAQYRTPLEGLYLCGAGCHPGGDLTGAAGYNAAREILP